MATTIREAPAGASFRIVRVALGGEIGRRLSALGFTEGAEGTVVRIGFLRGPIHVRLGCYDMLLRRSEAAGIEVEPIESHGALAQESCEE